MAEPDGAIRVFLLDDHEVVRRGVADLIGAQPDLDVVGEASTAAEALSRVPAARPDVAVLDVRLPDGDGVTVCRELRSRLPELRCLMLTSFADDDALFEAIMAGASGYVLKQIRGNDLVGAIRTVASGQSLLDPRTTARMMDRMRSAADPAGPAGRAVRPGAGRAGADRGGADQPGDRRAAVPGREDREELRVPRAGQARHAAPHPGGHPGHPSCGAPPTPGRRTSDRRRQRRPAAHRLATTSVCAARSGCPAARSSSRVEEPRSGRRRS